VKRMVGTTVRGIRAPIIKEGDNLVNIIVDCVIKAAESENFKIRDNDVIGITESLISRAQGNYASIDDIAFDINRKFSGDIAVLFPILSRNRFANLFKGIVKSGKKYTYFSIIHLMMLEIISWTLIKCLRPKLILTLTF